MTPVKRELPIAETMACTDSESAPPSIDATKDSSRTRFFLNSKGVFFTGWEDEVYVCGPLHVMAKTRGTDNCSWGRMLLWTDDDGEEHRWVMPMELLEGDGSELRRELSKGGLLLPVINHQKERHLLQAYIKESQLEARIRIVNRTGWHGCQYVTPKKTFGLGAEQLEFQALGQATTPIKSSGSLSDWISNVSTKALGNSRLTFAISVAFGAPILNLMGEQSGGFHIIGKSSSGKSILLGAAASVWSEPHTYIRTWRTTSNGLEGIAASHNDNLLILDELSQCDPREAGNVAYMLANGQGKARASRTGSAKDVAHWRLLFLSSGEESLSSLIASVGKTAKAGQEIRLAEFDADAGNDMGVFETCQDHPDSSSFARALASASSENYGNAGIMWLEYLVNHTEECKKEIAEIVNQFFLQIPSCETSSQSDRVARRFALVAAAGELATQNGLTGWQKGNALEASIKCFGSWRDRYGSTPKEDQVIEERVLAFFDAHQNSRFELKASTEQQRIHNQAGFYEIGLGGNRIYIVFTEVFRKEICQGLDYRVASRYLLRKGWLKAHDSGCMAKVRIPGSKNPRRVYLFTEKIWEEDGVEINQENVEHFGTLRGIDF